MHLCKIKGKFWQPQYVRRQYGADVGLDVYRCPHAFDYELLDWWARIIDDARQGLTALPSHYQGKPLFVTDELPHYGTVLSELLHELRPQAPTGKPGRKSSSPHVLPVSI